MRYSCNILVANPWSSLSNMLLLRLSAWWLNYVEWIGKGVKGSGRELCKRRTVMSTTIQMIETTYLPKKKYISIYILTSIWPSARQGCILQWILVSCFSFSLQMCKFVQ
jgi:hypothetical protein